MKFAEIRFGLPLLALVASAIICVQNVPYVTMFALAIVQGARILSALYLFIPAAFALVVLWTGYRVITRRFGARAAPVFGLFALGLIVLNDTLLPFTPLKDWTRQRALKGVRVAAEGGGRCYQQSRRST